MASRTVMRAPATMGFREASKGARRAMATWAKTAGRETVKGWGVALKEASRKELRRCPAMAPKGTAKRRARNQLEKKRVVAASNPSSAWTNGVRWSFPRKSEKKPGYGREIN